MRVSDATLYKTYELSYICDNPYNDITAKFTDNNGNVTLIKGFAAAKDIAKVRFYPSVLGMYTYEISGGIVDSGSFLCKELPGGFKDIHGIVKASGTHFKYDDGTWFNPFGTTVYAFIHQKKELVDRTIETLSESPFNKVRMCVFPKHYDFNHNEPDYFAFEKDENGKFDVNKPCFEFWDDLETRICQLDKRGIQCDLILFHPYDRWGFADLSISEAKTYLSYAIARLAAVPNIWWSLANEFDLMKYSKKEWEEIASFVAENDAYGHLLSNHNCIEFWDFDNKDTTHVCLQVKTCDDVTGYIDRYRKPVVIDECCYEGNITHEWGNISAFEMMNRFWIAVVQGGYCTHGETYMSDDDVLWWSKGGIFKGESVERIAFLKHIIDALPGPLTYCGYEFTKEQYDSLCEKQDVEGNDFFAAVARADWDRANGVMHNSKEYVGSSGEMVYLKYLERKCAAVTEFNLSDKYTYNIDLIDAWNMTRETVLTGVRGKQRVNLPGKEGIALLAYVVADNKA